MDPDLFARGVQAVIDSQSISVLDLGFYSEAPLFFAFTASVGLITGLNAPAAIGVFPVLIGVVLPLSTAIIVNRLLGTLIPRRMAILAALLIAVATFSTTWSYAPIAQTLSVVYWGGITVAVLRYLDNWSWQFALLIVLFSTALSYTHKLSVFSFFFTICFMFIIHLIGRFQFFSRSNITYRLQLKRMTYVLLFTGSLLAVQWTFATDYAARFAFRLFILLSGKSLEMIDVGGIPTAAVHSMPYAMRIISNLFSFITLLISAGLGWVLVYIYDRDTLTVQYLLAASSTTVALVAVGLFMGAINPARALFQGEFLLVALVALGLPKLLTISYNSQVSARRFSTALTRLALYVSLLVMVTSQIITPVAAPDFPDRPRQYLTSEEVAGKLAGYQYVDGNISLDYYAAVESSPPAIVAGHDEGKYTPITTGYVNATLLEQNRRYIAVRRTIDVYRTDTGSWELLWNPERVLNARYHRIYANDGYTLFRRPN
ncbi:hypothetical protein [Halomarina pelagica]|uniref:hypothetical protein n=1 Tax=Halomarina pelagica TaxID=2961599 RepID=UPI0020C301D0|nr:hypothetical protein [Halomarina sp. BND7]